MHAIAFFNFEPVCRVWIRGFWSNGGNRVRTVFAGTSVWRAKVHTGRLVVAWVPKGPDISAVRQSTGNSHGLIWFVLLHDFCYIAQGCLHGCDWVVYQALAQCQLKTMLHCRWYLLCVGSADDLWDLQHLYGSCASCRFCRCAWTSSFAT